MTTTSNVEEITVTEAAANAVKDLLNKRNLENYGLRVFISSSGCQGYQYGMALEEEPRPEDVVMEHHGITIIVDDVSLVYLHGATIDYIETETESGFKIDNPNAVSTCGCGGTSKAEKVVSNGGCGCGC
jgi:iron-sulfur cluster assembly protein